MIQDPVGLLTVLLAILAALFSLNRTAIGARIFKVIPLLVFAYFIPTLLSNTGVIPMESPLYTFIKKWLLPASLVLLTLSVDLPAIMRLGKQALTLFLGATVLVILGGPLAYLILSPIIPAELGEEAWKGLAALSGSWIGGGANFIAIGTSVGAQQETINMMVIVDVACANVWMAILFYFAGREKEMDQKMGSDRSAIEEVRRTVEQFEKKVSRPTSMPELLLILTIAFGATAIAHLLAGILPEIGDIVSAFTWVVIIVTTAGLGLSFTRVRNLEGAGASAVGSVFLFLLVTTIGAQGNFRSVLDAPAMVAVGFLWLFFHAAGLLWIRKKMRSPIFFLAVGSQANIGGAASAPIVASAFHSALAPVGVLLGVAGYVLGTYGGLLCAFLLEKVHNFVY